MTTKAHEVAHRQLDKLIMKKLSQKNDLALEIRPWGAAQIESGPDQEETSEEQKLALFHLARGDTMTEAGIQIRRGLPPCRRQQFSAEFLRHGKNGKTQSIFPATHDILISKIIGVP
ncbi:hypothetical protein N7519_002226 [Penicillium mononematosum]|uniref:uncharacterized protein n=1 Tax=Penicillium mononematosum TaxID=268346 RepID=UPI002546EF10|nr:uncharacterized protein N7519_002226 [Penicillium mononematosum]KAJ6187318.1 hypothetical protein N7519_002226 [Penicillium mononematosum]